MHLRQSGFTYSSCGLFTNTTQKMKFYIKDYFSKCDEILSKKLHFLSSVKKRIRKVKATEDPRYIYQNQLDKDFF